MAEEEGMRATPGYNDPRVIFNDLEIVSISPIAHGHVTKLKRANSECFGA